MQLKLLSLRHSPSYFKPPATNPLPPIFPPFHRLTFQLGAKELLLQGLGAALAAQAPVRIPRFLDAAMGGGAGSPDPRVLFQQVVVVVLQHKLPVPSFLLGVLGGAGGGLGLALCCACASGGHGPGGGLKTHTNLITPLRMHETSTTIIPRSHRTRASPQHKVTWASYLTSRFTIAILVLVLSH